MNQATEIPASEQRRACLRLYARVTGFTGLAALCGFLGAKTISGRCIQIDACGACALFKNCKQPQAIQTKQTTPAKVSPS